MRLEPKVMEVLVYFASRQGDVITRDELERDIWRGAIVGYDAVTKTVIKLRKAMGDDAKNPHCIVTIPKKGYQLIAPVHYPTAIELAESLPLQAGKTENRTPMLRYTMIVTGLLLVFAAYILYSFVVMEDEPSEKARVPSVLVLPFENLDEVRQYDAFVDGITDDVITDLSRLSGLFVFASNTSFQYKGKQVRPEEIRNAYGVDFILKGSVRRLSDTIRINVQLIDASRGFNVWAERYDRSVKKLFAVQNELTQQLVRELAIKVSSQEKEKLAIRPTANLMAYDHFLLGQSLSKQRTRESNKQAQLENRRAIELDPSYGRAYGALAFDMSVAYRRGWVDNPVETLDRALSLAEQATMLDSNTPQTYWVLGYVHMMRKDLAAAERVVKKAIAISPSYADGYGLLALINNHRGNAERAIKQIKHGMALNPFYTFDYPYNLGWAYYTLGQYEKAISSLEDAQERNENVIPLKLFLTASYVKAGRIDDAQWLVEQIQVLTPSTTISHIDNTIPISNLKLKMMLLDDLRRAGLPD